MKTIKEWYKSEFTTDELADEINPTATFEELKNNLPNVYEYLNVYDSVVRERCFLQLSNRLGVDYDIVFNIWLDN